MSMDQSEATCQHSFKYISDCAVCGPKNVELKMKARDVHYRLVEEYGLRDTGAINHLVRKLLEELAGVK